MAYLENKMYGDVNLFKTIQVSNQFNCVLAHNNDHAFYSKVILSSNSMYGTVNIVPPIIEDEVIYPKDTALEEANPFVSFHDFNTLTVGPSESFLALMKYDSRNILSRNIMVLDAKVVIYEIVESTNEYTLSKAGEQWDPINISWVNKPKMEYELGKFSRNKNVLSINVTDYIKQLKEGHIIDYGFGITSTDIGTITSNESYIRPHLVIKYLDLSKQVNLTSFDFESTIYKKNNSDKLFDYILEEPFGRGKSDKTFEFKFIKQFHEFNVDILAHSEMSFEYKTHITKVSYKMFEFGIIKRDFIYESLLGVNNDKAFEYNIYNTSNSDKLFDGSIYNTVENNHGFNCIVSCENSLVFDMILGKTIENYILFKFGILKNDCLFGMNLSNQSEVNFESTIYKIDNSDKEFNFMLKLPSKSENMFKYARSIAEDKEFIAPILKSNDFLFDYWYKRDDEILFEGKVEKQNDHLFECNILIFGSSHNTFEYTMEKNTDINFEMGLIKLNDSDNIFECKVLDLSTDDHQFDCIIEKLSEKEFEMGLLKVGLSEKSFESNIVKYGENHNLFNCNIEKCLEKEFEMGLLKDGSSSIIFDMSVGKINESQINFDYSLCYTNDYNFEAMLLKHVNDDCNFICDIIRKSDNEFEATIVQRNEKVFETTVSKASDIQFEFSKAENNDSNFEMSIGLPISKSFTMSLATNKDASFDMLLYKCSDKIFTFILAGGGLEEQKFDCTISKASDKKFEMIVSKPHDNYFDCVLGYGSGIEFNCNLLKTNSILFECEIGGEQFEGYAFII